jgi:hypothetical protein
MLRHCRTLHGTRNKVSALGTTEEKTVPDMFSILWYTSVAESNLALSAKFVSRSHILCVQHVCLYFLLQSTDRYWIKRSVAYDYAICFNAWCSIVQVMSTYGCYPPPAFGSSSIVLNIGDCLNHHPLNLIYCWPVKNKHLIRRHVNVRLWDTM